MEWMSVISDKPKGATCRQQGKSTASKEFNKTTLYPTTSLPQLGTLLLIVIWCTP